ncbi:Heterokaryon incompatibility protein 6- OR allele [Apiospora hydei]|uniref:Heterokaryon incompatibility protein 6- OR allele n=1 Tax=Apiospora hydei TaxID=1337664 RepID=A0ABR1UUU2_9PEZI
MSQPESTDIQGTKSPDIEAIDLDWDDYDIQIALDQLAGGSTEALKLFLARKEGVDPNTVSLVSKPWHAREEASVSFIGAVDDIGPPGGKKNIWASEPPPQARPIALKNTRTPYKYSELDPELRQFRLLKLSDPGEDGVIEHLELQTFSLSDAPTFFCLSYVWGDPNQFLAVNCNGGMVPVTQNLFHALRTCFDRYPDSWLWADGICINQQDFAERGFQVQLMGSIYEKTSKVLAHPGHYLYGKAESDSESEDNEPAMEEHIRGITIEDSQCPTAKEPVDPTTSTTLSKTTKSTDSYGIADFHHIDTGDAYSSTNVQSAVSIMTFLSRTWTVGNHDKTLSDTYWDKTSLPDLETQEGRRTWVNLLNFWSQDWYFRTWVLQEIVLAAKVVVLYRDTAISLDAITEFWSLAGSHGLPRVLRIGRIADMYNRVRHLSPVSSIKALRDRREKGLGIEGKADDTSTPSLLELLCLSRSNLATDPRDKVYGLLGLTDDDISRSIVPDYSQANTAARLFTDVALKLVLSAFTGDLLHHAGVDKNIPGLPSWVPDWTKQSRSTLPAHLYRRMGETTPKCSILDMEGGKPKLRVRGVIIAQINLAGAPWKFYSHDRSDPSFGRFKNAPDVDIAPDPSFNDEDARNLIFDMSSSFEEEIDIDVRYSGEEFQDAVARTLAADVSSQGHRIGRRTREASTDVPPRDPSSPAPNVPACADSDDFFAGLDAYRHFYARGPTCIEDLEAPGIRVHQTGSFMWLLDFDEEVGADFQHRMLQFSGPFQEAHRGRRFALLGTSVEKDENGEEAEEEQENYFMASVPWDAENEDYCVLLEGFRTPFILRKTLQQGQQQNSIVDGSGEEGFELVGDCYVHGIMDGELLSWADEIDEELGPEFRSINDKGREYVVRAPQGYVPFTDFVLV